MGSRLASVTVACAVVAAVGLGALGWRAHARAKDADGRLAYVFYGESGSELRTVSASGGSAKKLCAHAESPHDPVAMTLDGARIAFVDRSPTSFALHIARGADCEEDRVVATYDGTIASLKWSPDGSKLAYAVYLARRAAPEAAGRDAPRRRGSSGDWEVLLVDSLGSAPVDVSNDLADDSAYAWSPDGTRLAFVSARATPSDVRDGIGDVYVADLSGLSNLPSGSGAPSATRLTTGALASLDSGLAWSPDGTAIAFARFGPSSGIALAAATSGALTAVLGQKDLDVAVGHEHMRVSALAWAGGGTHLVFEATLEASNPGTSVYFSRVVAVRTDGTTPPTLLDRGQASCPVVSPDGARVAYSVVLASTPSTAIFAANVAGGTESELVTKGGSCPTWFAPL